MQFNQIFLFLSMFCLPLLLQALQSKSRSCSVNDIQLSLNDHEFFPIAPTPKASSRPGSRQTETQTTPDPLLVYSEEHMQLGLKAPQEKTYICRGMLKWNKPTTNHLVRAVIFNNRFLHPKASIFVNWSQFLKSQNGFHRVVQQTLLHVQCKNRDQSNPELKTFSQQIVFVPVKYKRKW